MSRVGASAPTSPPCLLRARGDDFENHGSRTKRRGVRTRRGGRSCRVSAASTCRCSESSIRSGTSTSLCGSRIRSTDAGAILEPDLQLRMRALRSASRLRRPVRSVSLHRRAVRFEAALQAELDRRLLLPIADRVSWPRWCHLNRLWARHRVWLLIARAADGKRGGAVPVAAISRRESRFAGKRKVAPASTMWRWDAGMSLSAGVGAKTASASSDVCRRRGGRAAACGICRRPVRSAHRASQ